MIETASCARRDINIRVVRVNCHDTTPTRALPEHSLCLGSATLFFFASKRKHVSHAFHVAVDVFIRLSDFGCAAFGFAHNTSVL